MKTVCRLTLLTLALACVGCANLVERADEQARSSGLSRREVDAGAFVLTVYSRLNDKNFPTHVYIEGDGLAWLTESEPSLNPTPRKALALSLVVRDPSPNVVYIARPCQFTAFSRSPKCAPPYWTEKRFAPEVIDSIGLAIEKTLGLKNDKGIHLIGYSGGGAVAVIVAARRSDVLSVRSVAGNLDHKVFTRIHGVSPMLGSLNAVDFADKISRIPQIHFVGAQDSIVPREVAESFVKRSNSGCVKLQRVDKATHETGWDDAWPSLLKEPVRCE